MDIGAYLVRDLRDSASERECIRHVRSKLRREARQDPSLRNHRHELYRSALDALHNARVRFAFLSEKPRID